MRKFSRYDPKNLDFSLSGHVPCEATVAPPYLTNIGSAPPPGSSPSVGMRLVVQHSELGGNPVWKRILQRILAEKKSSKLCLVDLEVSLIPVVELVVPMARGYWSDSKWPNPSSSVMYKTFARWQGSRVSDNRGTECCQNTCYWAMQVKNSDKAWYFLRTRSVRVNLLITNECMMRVNILISQLDLVIKAWSFWSRSTPPPPPPPPGPVSYTDSDSDTGDWGVCRYICDLCWVSVQHASLSQWHWRATWIEIPPRLP